MNLLAAAPAIDLGAALTSGADAIATQVQGGLVAAVPVGLAILAVGIGFRIYRRFVKG